jgi:putative CocE/NonD family hydrolase
VASVAPAASMEQYEVAFTRDVRIPSWDPTVTLGADLHLPVGAGPVPLIILALPYRKDFGGSDLIHRYFARRGYACMTLDLLGTGASDGDPRPPFSDEDADDAVAAILWAVEQSWCDGNVGMWGHSYGGMTTMRTASRRPSLLKAIIPVQGLIDPEADLVHPGHARGNFTAPTWMAGMLGNLLMPPMHAPDDEEALTRWRRRLERDSDAHVLDLFRHPPGDDVWRERVVDVDAIEVPALCWAGWRDMFADPMVRAFEAMTGPKRLIAGPWQHVLPVVSKEGALDFLGICTAWWDRWLRGVENGADAAPSACYVQGPAPYWTALDTWPPNRTVVTFRDTADRQASAGGLSVALTSEAEVSDPTVGLLSGFTKMAVPVGVGLPTDSHDDDLRSTCWTSEPLQQSLSIVGRAELALDAPTLGRVVARLHDVDPSGRSVFITSATLGEGVRESQDIVNFEATAYQVPAGHRLRVVVGDADFPRLWPLSADQPVPPRPRTIVLPTLLSSEVRSVELPDQPAYLTALAATLLSAEGVSSSWTVERNLVTDAVELKIASVSAAMEAGPGPRVSTSSQTTTTASPDARPMLTASNRWEVQWLGHPEVVVQVEVTVTDAGFEAHGHVTTGSKTTFERTWTSFDHVGEPDD